MSSSKEFISAIKTAIKRLEEFVPKIVETYERMFGSPAITAIEKTQEEGDKVAAAKTVQPRDTEIQEVRRGKPPSVEYIDLEGLRAVNLASLATFIAKLAGREGALKLLTTYKGMGFISDETYNKLTALIRVLPNYVPATELDDVWADVIIGLINLYEKNPTNWGFLLLIRLVEVIGDAHADVELE